MRRLLIVLVVVGLGSLQAAQAQRNPVRAQRLLEEADTLLAQGNVRGATVHYERALEADRDLTPAYLQLGRLAALDEDWGKVADLSDAVLKREDENLDEETLEAHLLRGIADRELGRSRPPLRVVKERLNWRDAEEHFEWVLARDSTFQDVLYQYGLLEQYRGRWERAFHLAHRQLALNPGHAEAVVGLFRLYVQYVELEPKAAAAWLAEQDHSWAAFFEAERLRRDGRLDAAEAALLDLLAQPADLSRVPLHLALTRIYVARDDPGAAETQFWSAVESIRTKADALLVFEDVKYIVTEAELVRFRSLGDVAAWQAFFRALWAERDPMPAADQNVRLVEHYRRLLYADEYFILMRPRAQFTNPDRLKELSFNPVFALNREYNDKGLIHIRHGMPNDRVMTSSSGNDDLFSQRLPGSVSEPLPVESWRYYATPEYPEMIFHFSSMAGGRWRLVPDVGTVQALEDRIEWGPLYNPRIIEPHRQFDMRDASQASIDAAMATDRHTWPGDVQPLDVQPLVATFRTDDGQTEVQVAYAFPAGVVAEAAAPASQVIVEAGAALHDRNWHPVGKQTDDVRMRIPQDAGSASFGQFRFEVPPDSYHVAVHVLPEGTDLIGGQKFDIEVPDYSRPELAMSDIVPAAQIEPATGEDPYARHGWRVLPNPTRTFSRERPIALYFEIYHLFLENDRTDYTVEYTLTSEKKGGFLRRLFGGGSRTVLSLQSPATGTDASPVEVTELDVSNVDAGSYTLAITVTDVLSGRQVTRERSLVLY